VTEGRGQRTEDRKEEIENRKQEIEDPPTTEATAQQAEDAPVK